MFDKLHGNRKPVDDSLGFVDDPESASTDLLRYPVLLAKLLAAVCYKNERLKHTELAMLTLFMKEIELVGAADGQFSHFPTNHLRSPREEKHVQQDFPAEIESATTSPPSPDLSPPCNRLNSLSNKQMPQYF
jgi:hypothetical protein